METHLLRFVERLRCLSDHDISTEFSYRGQKWVVMCCGFFGGDSSKIVASKIAHLIRLKSASLKEDYGLTTAAGEIRENVKKNRYRDILPYDQTRVCLTSTTSEYQSDYINANFIKGAVKNRTYIATQGPLSSTVVDFWHMIWQHNVNVIIMACREIEMGKKKCEVYWASTTDSSTFGPFTVSTLEESHPNEEVIVRALVVKYCDEARKVSHFQYSAWPDHGIPDVPDGILGMMELARQKQGNQTDPVVIHCSAGCGRTGVICAVDYVNDLLLTEQIQEDFNILDLVLELRRQRPSAVQTKEQYGFVFLTVSLMFQKVLQMRSNNAEPSTSLYINAVPPKISLKTTSLGSASALLKTRNPPLKPRLSLPPARMNDTYAVVNKSKVRTPSSAPHTVTVHYYDNAKAEKASNNAVYSTVKPKNRPVSFMPPSTLPIHDRTPTANQRGELSPKKMKDEGYELLPGELRSVNRDSQPCGPLSRSPSATESQSSTDDDYEYLSSVVKDTSSLFAPGSLGFNSRIKKPKGPRDPPAEWSRSER